MSRPLHRPSSPAEPTGTPAPSYCQDHISLIQALTAMQRDVSHLVASLERVEHLAERSAARGPSTAEWRLMSTSVRGLDERVTALEQAQTEERGGEAAEARARARRDERRRTWLTLAGVLCSASGWAAYLYALWA